MTPKIKKLREKSGITQQEIADKLGITRQTFSKMENWLIEPTLWQAVKLAQTFGVKLSDFIYDPSETIISKDIDWDKYKQIITNFIKFWSDSDGKITKTKLAKLCYLLDFSRYYFNLTPITGLEYRKIRQWPVPDAYFTAIEELQEEESIAIEVKWKSFLIENIGTPKHNKLSDDEINLLKKIANKRKDKNTQEIVDFTHKQLPWMICNDKEIIPYDLITQEDFGNVY